MVDLLKHNSDIILLKFPPNLILCYSFHKFSFTSLAQMN